MYQEEDLLDLLEAKIEQQMNGQAAFKAKLQLFDPEQPAQVGPILSDDVENEDYLKGQKLPHIDETKDTQLSKSPEFARERGFAHLERISKRN